MSLARILNDAYRFFYNHFAQLAVLVIPFLIIQKGLTTLLANKANAILIELNEQGDMIDPTQITVGGDIIAVLMGILLVFTLLLASLTLFLKWRSEGHMPSTVQVWMGAFRFVPSLLLAGVLSFVIATMPMILLSVTLAPVLIQVGAFIGFYLFARLSYVNFMVINENLTPLAAVKRSMDVSKLIVFKTILVLSLGILYGVIISKLTMPLIGHGFYVELIIDVAISFIGLFFSIALFRLYYVTVNADAKSAA